MNETTLPDDVRQTLRKIADPDLRRMCARLWRTMPRGERLEQLRAEAQETARDKAEAILSFDRRVHRKALAGEYGTEAKLMAQGVSDEPLALERLRLKLYELKGLEIRG